MSNQTQARIAVINVLFAYECGNEQAFSQAGLMYERLKLKNKSLNFATQIVKHIQEELETIDQLIIKKLKKWDIDRLCILDKSILRLGTYELYYSDLDKAIVINEAIEIAKRFSSDDGRAFVNGILSDLAKNKGDL